MSDETREAALNFLRKHTDPHHGHGWGCDCGHDGNRMDHLADALIAAGWPSPVPKAEDARAELIDFVSSQVRKAMASVRDPGNAAVPLDTIARETAQAIVDGLPTPAPQAEGDVRTLTAAILKSGPFVMEDEAEIIADAVLSSGLVVPVGERDDVLDEMQRVLADMRKAETERDVAIALVANVRREIERWDGYGHGLYNTHYESQLPCAVCDVLDEFRAALDTTPRA